jgi:hypothetical protein
MGDSDLQPRLQQLGLLVLRRLDSAVTTTEAAAPGRMCKPACRPGSHLLGCGDYVFSPADADTPYQNVVYVTRDRGDIPGPILVVAVGLGGVLLAVALARRRRRSTSHLPSA